MNVILVHQSTDGSATTMQFTDFCMFRQRDADSSHDGERKFNKQLFIPSILKVFSEFWTRKKSLGPGKNASQQLNFAKLWPNTNIADCVYKYYCILVPEVQALIS